MKNIDGCCPPETCYPHGHSYKGEPRDMFNFMPREEAFFTLFQQSSKNVIEGGRLLKELMENFQNIPEKVGQIKDVEHQGDEITHDIVKRLNQTFITPLDREDIHDLATALDDILDEIDAVADLFLIYKISQPTEASVKLADILYQASVEVGKGVDLLAHNGLDANHFSIHVNSLENEADRLSRNAISTLFDKEKDPIIVLKWKEIYESFETGADCCEDAANVLERIALKAT